MTRNKFALLGLIALVVCCEIWLVPTSQAETSATAYNKTVLLRAKDCQARLRGLPSKAVVFDGSVVYDGNVHGGNGLFFECFRGAPTPKAVGRAVYENFFYPELCDSTCSPENFPLVPGTKNVGFFPITLCGASGGVIRKPAACGYSTQKNYVLILNGAWIYVAVFQKSSSPSAWIVNMLQQSTFRVQAGAGRAPTSHKDEDLHQCEWTLPNYSVSYEHGVCDGQPLPGVLRFG